MLATNINENASHIDNRQNPRYKSYFHVLFIVINLSLSYFYYGYVLTYINTIPLPAIMSIFNITMPLQTARGILNGCIPVGAGIGAFLSRCLTHKFTRRNFILFTNFIAVIAGSLIFITNMGVLITMRLIQGLCIGFFTSTINVNIHQISPVQISGSTGSFTQIFASIGVTTAYLFYYILSVTVPSSAVSQIWYYVFGFPMISLVIQSFILIFIFPYETPKYHLMHHNNIKAKQLIAILYKEQYIEEILEEKLQDIRQTTIKEAVNKQSIIVKQQSHKNITEELNPNGGKLGKIKSKGTSNDIKQGEQQAQAVTPGLAVFAAFHLHIAHQFVGVNIIVVYGGKIISKSNPSMQSIIPIILNAQVLIGAILTIFILTKVGRKTMIQVGAFGLSLALLFITIGFFIQDYSPASSNGFILTGLFSYMFIFGASYGTILWLYVAEIAQPSIVSYATLITWLCATIVLVIFPILANILPGQNPSYQFLFFLLWTSISFVVNHFVLIQTKGKTEHQIHKQYTNLSLKHLCGCEKIKSKDFQVNQNDQTKITINAQHS